MKKHYSMVVRPWIGMIVLMTLILGMPVGQGLAQGTVMRFNPSSGSIDVGETIAVEIRIEDVSDLYGFDVQILFNPALLDVVDADSGKDGVQIQPGTFLSPDFLAQNAVDQANGIIKFAVTQTAPSQPVSGSGVLATITFRGTGVGNTAIRFDSALLSDQDGGQIAVSTENGNVTVGGDATPVPTNTPGPTETPAPTKTPGPTPVPGVILGYHTVKSGETLFCIARAYGVDPYAIARENGVLNPNLIRPGHVLKIPNVPRTLPTGPVCERQFDEGDEPKPPDACRWHHTVVRGENLYRISLRYGVNMWSIVNANSIANPNLIYVGQVLCIP
ncbi:MAG TPA: LysM peptidoglycan-binding domain-containing protein [Chloroflexi bacterium]|nr:LysM peptidoglycan-binding domain-containing protein [Chloroflexota bacterium]